MEAKPDTANLEPPVPDLFEAFADREVTVFGLTGTFAELSQMCPVDLNDPRVTVEMKNNFVVKAANEAGMAIEPEYESVFNRILEKKGLERKFTVALPDETAQSGVAKQEALQARDTIEARQTPARIERSVAKEVAVRQQAELVARISDEEKTPEVVESSRSIRTAERAKARVVPIVIAKAEVVQAGIKRKLSKSMKLIEIVANEPVLESEEQALDFAETARDEMIASILTGNEGTGRDSGDVIEPVVGNEIMWPGFEFDEVAARGISGSLETEAIIMLNWEAELTKKPLEVYEHFETALREFAELVLSRLSAGDSMDSDRQELAETAEPPAAIILEVADRLAELEVEEREAVAVTLKDIVGALHGLASLEAREADPEAIAVVEAELEELALELFEALGIEYDDEKIRQFVLALRDPEFKPAPAVMQELDLEHNYMHEVKLHFAQLVSSVVQVEDRLQQAIGGFALSAMHLTDLLATA